MSLCDTIVLHLIQLGIFFSVVKKILLVFVGCFAVSAHSDLNKAEKRELYKIQL